MKTLVLLLVFAAAAAAQPVYDLLLNDGHVIDPKNKISKKLDVAITDGKIALVADEIDPAKAKRVADVSGLYVTPGLIDLHVHVYAGTGVKALTGDSSVYPDGFSFRTGVTTMVDAGTAGWRNFPDFRERVIDRASTRVLALINIVAEGMSPSGENNPAEMDAEKAAAMAKQHSDIVVGFKTAHYKGPEWPSVDGAVKAGKLTNLPVMVDFGTIDEEKNLNALFLDKLRPGDMYTHCYSGLRAEVVDGKLNPAMKAGRDRGILFDVGHGGGSFFWNVVVPAFEAKFWPDSISTDLHTGSMNAGMKDMPNVMSKILNMGVPLDDVIRMSTWQPARQIQRPALGHLDVGAEADVTVLRLEKGSFGFADSAGARKEGSQRLTAEMTVRAGKVVWDLNARAGDDWKTHDYRRRRR